MVAVRGPGAASPAIVNVTSWNASQAVNVSDVADARNCSRSILASCGWKAGSWSKIFEQKLNGYARCLRPVRRVVVRDDHVYTVARLDIFVGQRRDLEGIAVG